MKIYIRFLAIALIAGVLLCGCRRLESEGTDGTDESTAPQPVIIYPEADGKRVVMLDAGHGFRDVGCDTELMNGTEADVTIAVVRLLEAELKERGITVILTHDGESFPSAEEIKTLADKQNVEYVSEDIIENDVFSAYERSVYSAAMAKEKRVDIFLSLHVNSIENNPEISRYEMYYYNANPYGSALGTLCEDLSEELDNDSRIMSRGYEDSFLVTKIGEHPSLLFEMGYATNKTDAENLNSEKWRESLAEILADGVANWISSYEQ